MKRNKNIIATILLIAVLSAAFIITSQSYYSLEKESCFHTLTEYTSLVGDKIEGNVRHDQEHLEMMSDFISNCDSVCSDRVTALLDSFQECGMISRLEILLPGDRVLLNSGELIDAAGKLSFEAEAAQGVHLSSRDSDLSDPKKMVLRSFVPIKKEGNTTAMLYGVIVLDNLADDYSVDAFDGNTQIYIIDGSNGDFLLDTWHKDLFNMKDLGGRPVKPGYSVGSLSDDIRQGLSGSIVFRSQKAGGYFYCYYEPVGVNQWMLMLSVPEDIVFGKLHAVMHISYFLAAIQLIVFIIYFVWMLVMIKKDAFEKENQLGRVRYMFDIEKILFNAHMRPERIREALCKIADSTTAEKVFFFITDGKILKQNYLWTSSNKETSARTDWPVRTLWECLTGINVFIVNKASLLYNTLDSLKAVHFKEYEALRQLGIKNMMATPILGIDGEMTGMLGVCNMKHQWSNVEQLECISLSFSLAINNIQVYSTIRKMGMIDSLTGLLNRNSYHSALVEIEKNSYHSLCCVFIDINGLHEINNHLGHEAGDKMLQFIASELKIHFGSGDTYRIGGDEFVALCRNQPKKEIEEKVALVKSAASLHHYQISSGIEWSSSNFNINAIIKTAEQRMQQDKRAYYQNKGDLRKVREMNHQLEKILTEKQDADAFLSVIATSFKGVYFVNMSSDTVRHIFIPPYFEEMLRRGDGKFSKAILFYSHEKVAPEYYRQFIEFCDFKHLFRQMEGGDVPSLIYQKNDGRWVKLRVFKFQRYTDENKETLWIFEDTQPSKK